MQKCKQALNEIQELQQDTADSNYHCKKDGKGRGGWRGKVTGRGEGKSQKASVCILEAAANWSEMYLMYEIRSKVYFLGAAPGTLLTGSLLLLTTGLTR